MRILNFADGFSSMEEPSQGTITSNNLFQFVDDAAFVAYKTLPATQGDIYINTTSDKVRVYDGSAWVELVSTDSSGDVLLQNVVIAGNLTVQGTTTTLNTQTLDVEDLNITVNKGGDDTTAQGAGLTVDRAGTDGSLVYDSTKESKWKAGNVGSESEVVTVSNTQTLTNKTLTSPVLNSPTGLVKADVGLGNVDNTSDATKNAAVATLTNKTLTAPVINSPTGLVKADVGLGNVDNTSDATKNAAAVTLTNKTLTAPVINSPTGIVKGDVGLGNVDNTSDSTKNAATATLSNKKFSDGVTFAQIATPASPGTGFNRIYPKADNNFYAMSDTGVESPLGSGSGGVKNYLGSVNNVNGNGNFELGSTAKWNKFNTTLTNKIPTGTITLTAASINNFVASASNRLAGSYSLWVTSTGAFAAGDGFISDAFDLDPEDLGKVLTTSFYYQLAGTGLVGAGTSANSFAFYLYDVANAAWLQPSGVYSMSTLTSIGFAEGQFQTASNATQYRLAVVCITASSGATDLHFDDFAVSPSQYVYGTPVTDWQDYTLTIGATTTPPTQGTSAVKSARWRRVGDSMELQFSYIHASGGGNAGSGTYLFPIPAGYTIDSSKVAIAQSSNGNNGTVVGNCITNDAGSTTTNFSLHGTVFAYSTTQLWLITANTTVAQSVVVNSTGPVTLGDTVCNISYKATVPILGWSSSVQMSDSADTRVVAFSATKSSNQAVTADVTNISFTSVTMDTHGAWNGTDTYTVPTPGQYLLNLRGYANGTGGNIYVWVTGVKGSYLANFITTNVLSGSALINLKAGDLVTIRIGSSGTTIVGDATLSTTLSIQKISGPSAIAATETIACRYVNTAGSAVATSTALVIFPTKTFDSHGAYNTSTGVFTVPAAGKYRVAGRMTTANVNLSTVQGVDINVYKNAVRYSTLGDALGNGSSNAQRAGGSDVIDCVAGDTIDIRMTSSVATTLLTAAGYNYLVIERIGL